MSTTKAKNVGARKPLDMTFWGKVHPIPSMNNDASAEIFHMADQPEQQIIGLRDGSREGTGALVGYGDSSFYSLTCQKEAPMIRRKKEKGFKGHVYCEAFSAHRNPKGVLRSVGSYRYR